MNYLLAFVVLTSTLVLTGCNFGGGDYSFSQIPEDNASAVTAVRTTDPTPEPVTSSAESASANNASGEDSSGSSSTSGGSVAQPGGNPASPPPAAPTYAPALIAPPTSAPVATNPPVGSPAPVASNPPVSSPAPVASNPPPVSSPAPVGSPAPVASNPPPVGSQAPSTAPTNSVPGSQVLSNIDPICALKPKNNQNFVYPAKSAPLPETVPEDCRVGFEMNNLMNRTYTINGPGTPREITLEIKIATYEAPDAIEIRGTRDNGEQYVLLQTCRMRTSLYVDPTKGIKSPPDDSIREYRAILRPGTVSLSFDFSRASTPTFLQIIGLCDFDLQPPGNFPSSHWRPWSAAAEEESGKDKD